MAGQLRGAPGDARKARLITGNGLPAASVSRAGLSAMEDAGQATAS